MPRQKKDAILSPEQIAEIHSKFPPQENSAEVLVPRKPSANLKAVIENMVRERVDEIMAERGHSLLEPRSQSREASYELQRRQTVFERRKWSLYFAKWGCLRCDKSAVSHASGGLCRRCQATVASRLGQIKSDYDKANPDDELLRQIDHLTRRARTAAELLGKRER